MTNNRHNDHVSTDPLTVNESAGVAMQHATSRVGVTRTTVPR